MKPTIDLFTGLIYLITNLVNWKRYVGLTIRPQKRYKKHWSDALAGSGFALHRAFRKYGKLNFKYEILCTIVSETEDDLKNRLSNMEAYYAEQLQTYTSDAEPGGYNMAWCGDKPTLGVKHTEDELEKMRKAHDNRDPPSDEQKKKTSESLKAFYANADEHQKQANADRAKRIGEKQRGRPKKQETKDAISKALTGRKDSPSIVNNKIASHTELGKTGHKYIKTHKWSGWIVYINNKKYGTFSKTFPILEEAISARDAFIAQSA
jgi:group I intron endonuclease